MKFQRKFLNITILGMLCLLLFFPLIQGSAMPNSNQTTKITFWYTENDMEKPGIIQLVSEYETAHPSIDVEAIQISFFNARDQYTTSFIGKTECDVLRATRDWIPEFAAAGMLLPLTDSFNESDLDDFIPQSIEMVTYPDRKQVPQIWAFPQVVDTPAIMFNKEIFELAGINTSALDFSLSWTWEEYWDILMKVNGTEYTYAEQTNNVYATTLAGMMFGAQPYYFGLGAQMFKNDSVYLETIDINSTESRYALWYLKNLTDSSVTPNWLDQGWGPLNPSFRSGKVAMINQGPWELKQNIETEPIFKGGDNLGIVQLPHDAAGHQGAPVGMHGYIVTSHIDPESAKYDAVIDFIKFMSGQYAQKIGSIEYYHVPSRHSVMDLTEVKLADSYKYVKGYWDAVQKALRVPVSKDWAQIEADFGDRINEYLGGAISLDECIARTMLLWSEYIPSLSATSKTVGRADIAGSPIALLLGTMVVSMIFLYLLKRKR